MAIKPLSKTRFDAFCYARSPYASYLSEEVEWYADEKENVLGVVAHDKVDNDWAFVVLGRDERCQFRARRSVDASTNRAFFVFPQQVVDGFYEEALQ